MWRNYVYVYILSVFGDFFLGSYWKAWEIQAIDIGPIYTVCLANVNNSWENSTQILVS